MRLLKSFTAFRCALMIGSLIVGSAVSAAGDSTDGAFTLFGGDPLGTTMNSDSPAGAPMQMAFASMSDLSSALQPDDTSNDPERKRARRDDGAIYLALGAGLAAAFAFGGKDSALQSLVVPIDNRGSGTGPNSPSPVPEVPGLGMLVPLALGSASLRIHRLRTACK